jgi:hypothetical protein
MQCRWCRTFGKERRRSSSGLDASQLPLAGWPIPADRIHLQALCRAQNKHLRTTNCTESSFATVRYRTVRSKGCLSNKTALAMMFKPASPDRRGETHTTLRLRCDRVRSTAPYSGREPNIECVRSLKQDSPRSKSRPKVFDDCDAQRTSCNASNTNRSTHSLSSDRVLPRKDEGEWRQAARGVKYAKIRRLVRYNSCVSVCVDPKHFTCGRQQVQQQTETPITSS